MYMLRFSSKHGILIYPTQSIAEPKKYKIIDTDNYLTEFPFIIPIEQTGSYNDYCVKIIKEEDRFNMLISNAKEILPLNPS